MLIDGGGNSSKELLVKGEQSSRTRSRVDGELPNVNVKRWKAAGNGLDVQLEEKERQKKQSLAQ